VLVEFASVLDAVRCAVETQRTMLDRDADVAEDRSIKFRIGVNLATSSPRATIFSAMG
jgi:adenylate cyclase